MLTIDSIHVKIVKFYYNLLYQCVTVLMSSKKTSQPHSIGIEDESPIPFYYVSF